MDDHLAGARRKDEEEQEDESEVCPLASQMEPKRWNLLGKSSYT